MTAKETVNLKEGDTIYVVVMSNVYSMYNPFARTYTSQVNYKKPLRVVKTKVAKIENYSHDYDSYFISCLIDTTPYQDLVWEGHYDNIPEGKNSFDYCDPDSLRFYGTYKNRFGDHVPANIFLTEEEANKYYNTSLKKFNTNIKRYYINLRCEIVCAEQNIEEAQKQVAWLSTLIK